MSHINYFETSLQGFDVRNSEGEYIGYEFDRSSTSPVQTNDVNADLLYMNFNQDFDSSSGSGIPIIEQFSLDGMDCLPFEESYHSKTEIQLTMKNPYFLLEIAGSILLNMLLVTHGFTYTLMIQENLQQVNILFSYVICKCITTSILGFISFILTTPDTYKSINLTMEHLMVNAIVYEYTFLQILQYMSIQLFSAAIALLITIGMYYEIIQDIDMNIILHGLLLSSNHIGFNYSYILITIAIHLCMSIGLTILTNGTNSLNARTKALQKVALLLIVSLVFGGIIGPVGYVFIYILFYIAIICITNSFHLLRMDVIALYLIIIVLILIMYPLIAINIKFVWRKKYLKYIEYAMNE